MRNGTGGLDVVGAVRLAKYGASSTWKLEAMVLAHVPSPPSSTLHAGRGSMSMTKSMPHLPPSWSEAVGGPTGAPTASRCDVVNGFTSVAVLRSPSRATRHHRHCNFKPRCCKFCHSSTFTIRNVGLPEIPSVK